jgi:serine/threonine-protein kinase
VVAEYLAGAEAAGAVDRDAFLARHPEFAVELRELFEQQDRFQSVVRPFGDHRRLARAVGVWEERAEDESTHADVQIQQTGALPGGAIDIPMTETEVATDTAGDDPAELASGTQCRSFGDYELQKVLGRGGMGVVYRARQVSLGRLVALKMIRAGLWAGPEEVHRFRNEAQAIANLDHPGIVTIHEVGQFQGQHYFTMKLVEGTSLSKVLREYALDPSKAARLAAGIARAVHHAHQRGILHRDLKPSNILLDAQGLPHVTDFGLAKRLAPNAEQSLSGSVVGTPSYMSPEQARGHRSSVTMATDVYGIGAILYAMVSDRPPFQGDSVIDTLAQVQSSAPERPSLINRRVGRNLETICLKCLEKDPRNRYPTADALADDLENFLADRSIVARRSGLPERAWRWCRRNPALGALAALAATLTIAIGLSTSVSAYRNGQLATRLQAKNVEANRNLIKARDNLIQAQTMEAEARDKQAEAKAVLGFVQEKILAAARPEGILGGLGREVTLRKALESSLMAVESSFQGRPLVEAAVRMALGTSFGALGDNATAEQQFQIARKRFTDTLGPNHPDTLSSMNDLALSYDNLGRHEDALKLGRETLEARQTVLGTDHPDTLRSMHRASVSYWHLGRYEEARTLSEKALSLLTSTLGRNHSDTLRCMDLLARTYQFLRRHEEALNLAWETVELRRATLGAENPLTLFSIGIVADVYDNLGRHEDALRLREESLELLKAKLGAVHPDTLTIMNDLAFTYNALGRHEKALRLRRETLELRQAKLGVKHPHTLLSMANLAESLLNLDRGTEALVLVDDCLRLAMGKDIHPQLVPFLLELRFRVFAKKKDAASCRETAERFEQVEGHDADSLYLAACLRALIAGVLRADNKTPGTRVQADAEADKAMGWLEKAVAAGYHTPMQITHMAQDPDLDAVRGRECFRRLLAGLLDRVFPTDPFASDGH